MTDFICTQSMARPAGLSFWSRLRMWRTLAAQRRQLGQLDADQLCDIGVQPTDAAAEAARPAWDVPAHWQQSS